MSQNTLVLTALDSQSLRRGTTILRLPPFPVTPPLPTQAFPPSLLLAEAAWESGLTCIWYMCCVSVCVCVHSLGRCRGVCLHIMRLHMCVWVCIYISVCLPVCIFIECGVSNSVCMYVYHTHFVHILLWTKTDTFFLSPSSFLDTSENN